MLNEITNEEVQGVLLLLKRKYLHTTKKCVLLPDKLEKKLLNDTIRKTAL